LLVLPDFEKPFSVVVDACDVAVGGVLLQGNRPVAYYSRKLNPAEVNYGTSDREMLAVIFALREWRYYLHGAKFTIVADHRPNTYLDATTNSHALRRRARWLAESSDCTYDWVYQPGSKLAADPVLRAPQLFSLLPRPSRVTREGLHSEQGLADEQSLQQDQPSTNRAVCRARTQKMGKIPRASEASAWFARWVEQRAASFARRIRKVRTLHGSAGGPAH
jgi:hypothetical protein